MFIITIANRKGGVSKTTTAHELAAGLTRRGYKVLSVDFDPQGSLTQLHGLKQTEGLLEALEGTQQPEIVETAAGGLIASSVSLLKCEAAFSNTIGKEYRLKEMLQGITGFDYCIIDTPPALGFHAMNALTASQALIIPVLPDAQTPPEVVKMFNTVQVVRKYTNSGLDFIGLLLCLFEPRRIVSRQAVEVYQEITDRAGGYLFRQTVRRAADLPKAQGRKQSIYDFAADSPAAVDYEGAIAELLEQIGGKP